MLTLALIPFILLLIGCVVLLIVDPMFRETMLLISVVVGFCFWIGWATFYLLNS